MKEEHLYFIAIIPEEPIESAIIELKQHVFEKYNSKAALRSPPHITLLMPFKFQDRNVDKLIGFLKDFSRNINPFEIQLKDFGSFPPRVIYVDVAPSSELATLHFQLNKEVRKEIKLVLPENPNRPFRPHMTIGFRDLKKPNFFRAWEEFQERSLNYSFKAEGLYLLKHNGKTWDKHRFFRFNLPDE